MSTYKLTDEALQDLDDIFSYLSSYSLDGAWSKTVGTGRPRVGVQKPGFYGNGCFLPLN
ncbi:MAG: hypothetical protein AB4352_25625 [Hormoscilla sp.]